MFGSNALSTSAVLCGPLVSSSEDELAINTALTPKGSVHKIADLILKPLIDTALGSE